MNRTPIVLLLMAGVLTAGGCGATHSNRKNSNPTSLPGDSTPQKTFEAVNAALLKGDLAAAYELLASAKKRTLSFEQFQGDFQDNRADWVLRVQGAQLKFVTIDSDGLEASAKVIWGDGLSGVVDFVRERGIWRENNFYPLNATGE